MQRILWRMVPGLGLLASFLSCAMLVPRARAADAPADRPNIVFILADDQGWTDLGCYGSTYYRTPEIDRMAGAGMRFTNGYTCGPNCQPTRAALMSGQYAPRTGVYTVGGIDRFDWQSRNLEPVDNVTKLDTGIVTIAESLRDAGYATGMFGKWHLGDDPAHHPSAQGFDEAIVSAGRHFQFVTNPKVEHPPDQYLADFLTDRAVDYIQRHKDETFFLYLPHFAVHSPFEAKESLIETFQDVPPAGGHSSPVYAAMIKSVDESVGRVLKTIDELGLGENTLVIYSSDNGGVGGYQRAGLVGAKGITDNAPLRSGKGSLYEGGVRVPYIFRWTGVIEPGTTCDAAINSVDLYPTLLDLAGAKPPATQALDGSSYLGLLVGKSASTERPARFWHFPGYLGAGKEEWRTTPVSVVRDGDWKLMEFLEDGHLELYNLAQDIGEDTNLAVREPAVAKRLHEALTAWRQAIDAPMPRPHTPQAATRPRESINNGGVEP